MYMTMAEYNYWAGPGTRSNDGWKSIQRAMDAAPPDRDDPEERNRRVAAESLATATRRQESGNDGNDPATADKEKLQRRMLDGLTKLANHLEKQRDAELKRKSDELPGLMDALIRQRHQVRKAVRQKAGLDALHAQQAQDQAYEDREAKHQAAVDRENAQYKRSLVDAGKKLRREALDVQPDPVEMTEIPEWDLNADYKRQLDQAGEQMRARYQRQSPALATAPVARHQSALADIDDDYAGVGKRLRGLDARLTPESKLQAEHRIARQKLEAR